jgi:SAM-dependent methyltransferase
MIALEKAGFDAYGVEPSAPFRDRAIERMGRDPRRIAHATVESASFPASHFTLITFGAVLEHLYDPAAALRRALDWLSPGGLIHIEAPSARWLVAKMANLYYRLAGTDYVANLSPMHPPYHLHEFTLPAFRAFCAGTGCEVAHHEDRICSTYLPRLFDPIAKGLMKLTKTGLELEVWLRKTAPAAAGRS